MTETPAERVLSKIRETGGRSTVSTRLVVNILSETTDHLTAEDLMAELERRLPGVAPSTVYRVLQRLDELGVVEQVRAGLGAAVYHLGEQGHAHLICNRCGLLTDLPAMNDHLQSLARTTQQATGFTLDPHGVALVGQCGSCSTKSERINQR